MQVKSTKKLKKMKENCTQMAQMTDFQYFLKVNKLKQNQVADYLGTSSQYVNQVANGKCALSDDKLRMLAQSKWDISMLDVPFYIAKDTTTEPNAVPIQPMEVNIDTGESAYKEPEPIPATAEVIPILPTEIARRTNTNIREFIEKRGDELEHIDPRQLLHSPDLAERVMGASMLPTFAPGDVVFVKFLPDINHIIDGKTYYLDLRSLPTMVRKVKIEGEQLRLIAKNPNYGDVIIDRTELQNVGIIVGMFRNSFADGYDEVEAVRRKKDNQIDKLIDQNAKALESIGNLVEVIRNER